MGIVWDNLGYCHCKAFVWVVRRRISEQKFRSAGRATPAPWLSLWESWRANSEPERAQAVANMRKVPRLLHGTLSVTATPCQLPHRGSQGRLRRRIRTNSAFAPPMEPPCHFGAPGGQRTYADGATELPMQIFRCAGRATPAPWLSLWESWHGVAVTERVPCSNLRTLLIFAAAHALSGSPLARQLSHRESQGRLRRQDCADNGQPHFCGCPPWFILPESSEYPCPYR